MRPVVNAVKSEEVTNKRLRSRTVRGKGACSSEERFSAQTAIQKM